MAVTSDASAKLEEEQDPVICRDWSANSLGKLTARDFGVYEIDSKLSSKMLQSSLQAGINLNQIVDIANEIQVKSKSATEKAITDSLNQVDVLFEDATFFSMDKAINEVVGLLSIRLREECNRLRSEVHTSILNIISTELSKTNCSFGTLIYQLESLRELAKQYELQLAKRESVIEVLKSENAQAKEASERKVLVERNLRKKVYNQLAFAHARRVLMLRVWTSWKRSLECTWKRRVQKRLEKEAQQACIRISQDYEIKIAELRERLQAAELRCKKAEMLQARTHENLKSALMRGVCALNMETMSVLQPDDAEISGESPVGGVSVPSARVYRENKNWEINKDCRSPTTTLGDSAIMKSCVESEKPERLRSPDRWAHSPPNECSTSGRNFSASRVKFADERPSRGVFASIEPVDVVTATFAGFDINRSQNGVFRAHTVQHGAPAGPSVYSSASFGTIQVQRHNSTSQVCFVWLNAFG
ncbi:unnamed protein product [Mesocestoides corti]|uniref:Centrosomal protein POC5 n=1 Tax=Mesocestoides corti TaxID=53468 RepID=A0A0R3UDX0_MESCO|nr:unnamed protein product [Mesocestoides corti]